MKLPYEDSLRKRGSGASDSLGGAPVWGFMLYLTPWMCLFVAWGSVMAWFMDGSGFLRGTQPASALVFLTMLLSFMFVTYLGRGISGYDTQVNAYYAIFEQIKQVAGTIATSVTDTRAFERPELQEIQVLMRYLPYFVRVAVFRTGASVPFVPHDPAYHIIDTARCLTPWDRASYLLARVRQLVTRLSADGLIRDSAIYTLLGTCETAIRALGAVRESPGTALVDTFIRIVLWVYYATIPIFLWPAFGWWSVLMYAIIMFVNAGMLLILRFRGSPFSDNSYPDKTPLLRAADRTSCMNDFQFDVAASRPFSDQMKDWLQH